MEKPCANDVLRAKWQEATKTILANKDNSCSSFFIPMGAAQMWGKNWRAVPTWDKSPSCLPLETPVHVVYMDHMHDGDAT